jgi:hypothetical protein
VAAASGAEAEAAAAFMLARGGIRRRETLVIAGRRKAAFGSVAATGTGNGKRRGRRVSIAVNLGFVLLASCHLFFPLHCKISCYLISFSIQMFQAMFGITEVYFNNWLCKCRIHTLTSPLEITFSFYLNFLFYTWSCYGALKF